MSTMIQIRNVPDKIHRMAKARAAMCGMTMSEYILRELEKSLEAADWIAHASRARMKVGEVTALDMYSAEMRLAETESALVRAGQSHEDALDELKLVVGLPLDRPVLVHDALSFCSFSPRAEKEDTDEALRTRSEIRLYREAVKEAEAEVRKSQAMNDFLQRMLASVDPQQTLGREVPFRAFLDQAVERLETDLQDEPEVQAAVGRSGVEDGVCLLFCPHTTAGVTLNKKWDPSVRHPIGVWR